MTKKILFLFLCYLTSLHSLENIPYRSVPCFDKNLREFYFDEKWNLIDEQNHLVYLDLDNQTLAGYEDLADDPFLVLRTKTHRDVAYDFTQSCRNFASFNIFPETYNCIESDGMTTLENIYFQYNQEPSNAKVCPVAISNRSFHFNHKTPSFNIESSENIEKIYWQISTDQDFHRIIPNFEGIQEWTNYLCFDALTDTFFNSNTSYYFRIKALQNGLWSSWSPAFEFSVSKPDAVKSPTFQKLGDHHYEISWIPSNEPDTQYHIFASNAFDFIPSIYVNQQPQLIDDKKILSEKIDNYLMTTKDCSIHIGTEYAFYRIIAECHGQFSTPSPLIRVYDYGLHIPRTVLQGSTAKPNRAERIYFPAAYSHIKIDEELNHFDKSFYTKPPHVESSVWYFLKPYFLPENHPIKSKLDRLFSTRVLQNKESLIKAGFVKPEPMRYSKTIVSQNKNLPGYMFKFFSDEQKGILDWQRSYYRLAGSIYIQDAINRYNIGQFFTVPTKWIYPLPNDPAPKGDVERKNFIIVETFLDIYTGKENNKKWKSPVINQNNLILLYALLQELGLSDSVYAFNLPITKDHKIAFIDTEHYHKWPVPMDKLNQYLSPYMETYWKQLIKTGGAPN